MPKNPFIHPHDLISPDGKIVKLTPISSKELEAIIEIEDISNIFGIHSGVSAQPK